jgi:ABC-type Fe3+/spermidine/putrescine transport system ATPase subunit
MAAAGALVLRGLRKTYGNQVAVDDVSLAVPAGSLLALLGPSGCGKTTILRSIAGFVEPDAGRIELDGQDVTALAPERRGTAMVFQNYALFPHMTVAANVGFGLRMRRLKKPKIAERVAAALAMVQLSAFADRYPQQLSGGQQQRAALARAIVTEPRLLLLDEPFGALDQNLREDMQVELRKLQQRLGITAVVVTHDQQEAMILADLVAVMQSGRIEQMASPVALYDRPATRFVAGFVGAANILAGRCEAPGSLRIGDGAMAMPSGDRPAGAPATIAVRPEAVQLLAPSALATLGTWTGTIGFVTNLGGRIHYEVRLRDGTTLTAEETRRIGDRPRHPGDIVGVRLDPALCALLRD